MGKINVGGQAVIEGVMMRSPEYVSVAVRRPNGKIVVKREPFVSWTKRFKILSFPLIRGGVILIESLFLGIKALNFSGEIAMEREREKTKPKKSEAWTKLWLAGTVIFALVLGTAFFFFLPLWLSELTGVKSGIAFNLIDGGIRLILFLSYLVLISSWKEIRRIFEYHGAEHKSVFAYEDGKPLTLEGARPYSTHHPRCGTSFLLVVMLVAIVVFVALGKPNDFGDRLIRFLFIPVIGGISYEIIWLSGKKYGKRPAQILVAPGLWLQKITTKQPDDDQLEVALISLKSALNQNIGTTVEIYSP